MKLKQIKSMSHEEFAKFLNSGLRGLWGLWGNLQEDERGNLFYCLGMSKLDIEVEGEEKEFISGVRWK